MMHLLNQPVITMSDKDDLICKNLYKSLNLTVSDSNTTIDTTV